MGFGDGLQQALDGAIDKALSDAEVKINAPEPEYKIVFDIDRCSLAQKLNAHQQDGWRLYSDLVAAPASITMAPTGYRIVCTYSIIMVRSKKEVE